MNIHLIRDLMDNEDNNKNLTQWKVLKKTNPKLALEIALNVEDGSKHRKTKKISETDFEADVISMIKENYHVRIPRNTTRKYFHRRDDYTKNGLFKGSSKYWLSKLRDKI